MPQNKFQGHIFLYKKGVEGAFFIVFFSRIDFLAVLFFYALSLKILAFLLFLTL